jgi:hypothetical protein
MQPQYITLSHKAINITGQRFGRLIALGPVHQNGKLAWHCRCDCGQEKAVMGNHLRSGKTQSCGCLHREKLRTKGINARHGMSQSRVYKLWRAMRKRCQDINAANYHRYGGRGISVCERWQSFENFYSDMGEPPSDQHSLDRIDNDGNYEPTNCQWATINEQAQNKSTTIQLTYTGETRTLREWSAISGISPELMRRRIRAGFSPDQVIFQPNRKVKPSQLQLEIV